MSDAPPTYFWRSTNLSRQTCSWLREYFRLYEGLCQTVSVYEDGFAYTWPAAALPVPANAKATTATVWAKALAKAEAGARKRKALATAEKELRNKVDAMRRGLSAPAPMPIVQPVNLLEAFEELLDKSLVVAGPQLLDDYTVLDTEFIPEGARLLEVAAVRYRKGEPTKPFKSFVRCEGLIPRQVSELTGITAVHVATAPSEKAVLGLLRQYAGDSLLVAHNISADRRIIEATRTRLGATDPLPNPWLCTMALARKRLPKGQKCGLGELCQAFGFATHGAHRALRDVEMCDQVLRYLHQQQPVTKGDLYGAPQASKSKKVSVPTGPGLFASAA